VAIIAIAHLSDALKMPSAVSGVQINRTGDIAGLTLNMKGPDLYDLPGPNAIGRLAHYTLNDSPLLAAHLSDPLLQSAGGYTVSRSGRTSVQEAAVFGPSLRLRINLGPFVEELRNAEHCAKTAEC